MSGPLALPPPCQVARVSPAHVQGFYPNVQQFLDRAVTHSRNSQYRPSRGKT